MLRLLRRRIPLEKRETLPMAGLWPACPVRISLGSALHAYHRDKTELRLGRTRKQLRTHVKKSKNCVLFSYRVLCRFPNAVTTRQPRGCRRDARRHPENNAPFQQPPMVAFGLRAEPCLMVKSVHRRVHSIRAH